MDRVIWEIIGQIGNEVYLIGTIRSLSDAQRVGTLDLARQFSYSKGYNFKEIRKKR